MAKRVVVSTVSTTGGGGVSSVSTGNMVYVDAVNGSDSGADIGLVDRFDRPFLTLAAAKAAASSGDTIVVRPGNYTVTNTILKNGVNWHFEDGASVTMTAETAQLGILDDSNTAITCKITGHGSFSRSAVDDIEIWLVAVRHASSNIYIEGNVFDMTYDPTQGWSSTAGYVVYQENGRLSIVFDKVSTSGTGTGEPFGLWWAGGEMLARGQEISTYNSGAYSAVNSAIVGDCFIDVMLIDCHKQPIVCFGSDPDVAMWVTALKIISQTGTAVGQSARNKLYVKAQKIIGHVGNNSVSGGLLYVETDKISAAINGTSFVGSLFTHGSGSTGYTRIRNKHWDPNSYTGETITIAGGTADIDGGDLVGGTAKGLVLNSGSLNLSNIRIDTSANNATQPITVAGGTLNLGANIRLIAHSSVDSIYAASAQTVYARSVVHRNRPINANITLDSSDILATTTRDGLMSTTQVTTLGTALVDGVQQGNAYVNINHNIGTWNDGVDDWNKGELSFIVTEESGNLGGIFFDADVTNPAIGLRFYNGGTSIILHDPAIDPLLYSISHPTEFRAALNLGTMATEESTSYLAIAGGQMTAAVRHTEVTATPSGTTQTLTLTNGNHQTIALTSASGNVTLTLTVPSGSSAGTIIVKQHASAQKDLTWAVSAGTIKWMGTEPDWISDAVSSVRVVSWRYDGSVMYLASTEVGT